ncbi:CsbD family protein [Nonomuraea sp. NPDC050556]|uniref:CsbD family protein n=1 Tax=Nonomuraea sp. NPDC050556 TaxID=3364369 RepID=UPI00378A49BE
MKKISANLQIVKGRVMRRFGRATGNGRTEARGGVDQVAGHVKLTGEKAKDAFKN